MTTNEHIIFNRKEKIDLNLRVWEFMFTFAYNNNSRKKNMESKKKWMAVLSLVMVSLMSQAQPRLVVGIVVDQMRWDYLERYKERYGKGGFRRMMDEGYNCTRCMINYLPAVTAVGHSSVYTGSVPAFTGIVGNHFYVDGRSTSAPYDESMETVGSETKAGKRSPHNLMATTIGDELRMATNFRSKVIGVAIKDRASILPAGHAANGAYWLDESDDRFITSSYYMKELPQWVVDFNTNNRSKEYMQRDWPRNMMYPEDTYLQSHPRDTRIEHSVGKSIRTSPWGATLTLDMARAAIEGEALGSDEFTDLLCVSISSTDAMAHQVGCNSQYMEDAFLWLDHDLEEFFSFLDKKVGKGKWTAFLTADHGGSHNPQWRMDHKIPAQVWESTQVVKDLNQLIADKLGATGKVILGISSFKVMMDEQLIKAQGLERNQVTDLVVEHLKSLPMVQYAFDVERIPDNIPEPLRTMTRNGFYPGRTGQIQLIPVGGVMEANRYGEGEKLKGASHMLWGPDDTHIPFVLMGWGIPHGENHRIVHITDIAPTICSLLHIQEPSACVGESVLP